jgi:hypothetical protein
VSDPKPEAPRCPSCDVPLERLGGAKLRTASATVEIEHFVCPRCGRRRMKHSQGGLKDTNVDLTAD